MAKKTHRGGFRCRTVTTKMVVETNKIEFNQEKKTGENPISELIDK